ncbi:Histone H1-III [Frankliniella fusca]|uniref:Histone H1-III n=1 Tax=Frankliniella fusca TaxID=407009 RepID=A0AAE1I1K1_9NEOP|nr:Histone H1-III [Frankliniella fusca]
MDTKASTADMVRDAIKTLGERGGSSLHNIKKYIEAVYKVDMRYRAPRIRKFLRVAVSDGAVVQTAGRGASGSFKLPPKPKPAAAPAPAPAAPARVRASTSTSRRRAPAASTSRASSVSRASTTTSAPSSPRSSPSASSVASSTASRVARDERAKARESRR